MLPLLRSTVLAIAGMEAAEGPQLIINTLTLGSIFWWIWLVTDAFDFGDVAQQFKYSNFVGEVKNNPQKYTWLRLTKAGAAATAERQGLVGSFTKDVALWFMMACIVAAWYVAVAHVELHVLCTSDESSPAVHSSAQ